MKINNKIKYVNRKSNHAIAVIRKIPDSINHRLINNSSNKEIFKKGIPEYQKALRASGYDHVLEYKTIDSKKKKKNRGRKSIWFTPPYNRQVITNIGRIFIELIKKHFPKHNALYKISNGNNVKIGYSCMDNFERIIKKPTMKNC